MLRELIHTAGREVMETLIAAAMMVFAFVWMFLGLDQAAWAFWITANMWLIAGAYDRKQNEAGEK